MSELRNAARDYLALRRSLGFKLAQHGIWLEEFAAFMAKKGSSRITTALALEWATQHAHHKLHRWAARLSVVRGFARLRSATDPATEVPPPGLIPYRPARAVPYIYSHREIRRLLGAANDMAAEHELRPWTYYCLFGLLAVTGLRLSKARNLRTGDVDWTESILTIRDTKFGKTRLVPVHPSTRKVLAEYAKRRIHFFGEPVESHFFVNRKGQPLDQGDIHRTFYRLSREIGLRGPSASHGPRIHDFRHRVAVLTLLNWYRKGDDAQRRMPILSTFLGHAQVTDTYWYLTGTPRLLGAAAKRLEKRWEGLNAGR
jgi:integrase/recombinase XerD